MTPSSVLVVKPSSLGDIVQTLPAVHFLKTTFRNAEFSWITNAEWVPLLEQNGDLTTIIPFPRGEFKGSGGVFKFFRWCQELAGLQPDLVLDFQGLFRSAWISRSSKGKSVLGLSDSREASRFFYDQRAIVHSGQHSVERYLALARLAGADTSGLIQFPLPPGKAIPLIELPERYVLLHPFARGARKSLTAGEIFEFTRLVAPIPVVVAGRSNEQFTTDQNGISLVNQTSLPELVWLLRRSSFIVSVDSGPMHIGAAITSELLSIHLWSNPGSVGPYNPEAWIWKDRGIVQVRANRAGESNAETKERPDIAQIAGFVRDRLLH